MIVESMEDVENASAWSLFLPAFSLPVILLPPLSFGTLDGWFLLADCSNPTESRLASEFNPNFSFFLSTAEQISVLQFLARIPILCSQTHCLVFCPCALTQHFSVSQTPLRDALLPSFLQLPRSPLFGSEHINCELVRMVVNGPAKSFLAVLIEWCRGRTMLWFFIIFLFFRVPVCFLTPYCCWCSTERSWVAARDCLLIPVALNAAECRCTRQCLEVVQVLTLTLLVSSFLWCYHLFRRWEEMWKKKVQVTSYCNKMVGGVLVVWG